MGDGQPLGGRKPFSRFRGRGLLLLAAVLWSTSGLFAKSPAFSEWPISGPSFAVRGPLLAFWRAAFACVVLLPLIRTPRWTPRLIPAVLAFAAMNVTFLTALTTTTAANAIWLQYTAPAWVFVLGRLIWREPTDRRDLLMLACGLLGVAIILAFEMQGESTVGVGCGLLAGLAYAGVVLTLRWLRDQDTAWIVGLNHLVTAILLAPFVFHAGIWPTSRQFVFLAGFGILQMGIPYWLFARGLRTTASHEASLIVLIEPLLVPVWVFLAWHNEPSYEGPRWWTLLGGAVILAGLVLRYVRK